MCVQEMQQVDNEDGFFSILGPLNAKEQQKRASMTFGDPAQAKVERAQLALEKAQARLAKAQAEQHAPRKVKISVTDAELQ